jgi:hypothetical protein
MPQRHHNGYGTLRTWKIISDSTALSVVPSATHAIQSWLITIVVGIGMYWVANHMVSIEDQTGLVLWNSIVIGTPLLMLVVFTIQWALRDKRPYFVVHLKTRQVYLPRLDIQFPVEDQNATFVHDIFLIRGDDDVSEFNLVFHIGPNETSYPILKALGRCSSLKKLGKAIQTVGLHCVERKTTC